MSNVKDIFKGDNPALKKGEPNEILIANLKECLRMAEAGDLQFIVATGFLMGRVRLSFNAGYHDQFYEVIGAIEELKREYAAKRPA